MMYDRLICPNLIELAGTKELIQDNFPLAHMMDIEDPDDLICDFDIEVTKPTFFRWAILRKNGTGIYVVNYCYNLSILLFDPPPWMRGIMADLNIPLRMLSEGDNLQLF